MKLYLASQPQFDKWAIAAGQKYILISYHFIRKAKLHLPGVMRGYLQTFRDAGIELLIDSGAHTFQKDKTTVDYQAYFESYLHWLKENSDLIGRYVELDIENVVGMDKVNEWSDTLTKHLPTPPIRVWHRWRGGIKVWEDMCRDNDYVGFSGFLIQQGGGAELPLDKIPLFLKIAAKHDCKVHGFGFTNPSQLSVLPFYSVDSSSWMAAQRFGHLHYFDGKTLQSWGPDEIRKKLGCNTRTFNWKKAITFSALQWKLYADYLKRIMP